ncbi:MAG: tRNA (adenosine(37)-N6)-threonylcarbamoyltransferase complex transferase subunit TsaD [Spirochaetota bacterium]|nr:MAG: tRNA (adenosine(37)-N6)-threonylcarbamoyltransferase complex transferase subunit TsaD [Spirochaetota bacterium]
MNILGIETTCDETAASIVKDGTQILSNIVATQHEFHREYAGVVPEIASRRHSEVINYVIEKALKQAGSDFKKLDAIAVSYHPGLIGSLLVGVIAAKTLSYTLGIPLIGINHIEAHLYSVHFNNDIEYPVIGLIISGGHTLLITSDEIGEYTILGSTLDDAAGEAFDKVAKHLGLGYPGGPAIEYEAKKGNENAYGFPCVTLNGKFDRYNFSYSGLKNAVINQRNRFLNKGFDEKISNIAASFQKAATDVLLVKVRWAAEDIGINRIVVAGGVANNSRIRGIFKNDKTLTSYFPDPALTQDNAAMVAGLAYHKYIQGEISDLELEPKSRLEEIAKGKRKVYGS